MNTNFSAGDLRELSMDELDVVTGAGGATVYEGEVFNIAGKGELEIGVKESPNGTKTPYAVWTPNKPK